MAETVTARWRMGRPWHPGVTPGLSELWSQTGREPKCTLTSVYPDLTNECVTEVHVCTHRWWMTRRVKKRNLHIPGTGNAPHPTALVHRKSC